MNKRFELLRIHTARSHANFDVLVKIGGTPDGEVHRPALNEADLEKGRDRACRQCASGSYE